MIRGLLHRIAHLLGRARGTVEVRRRAGRYHAVFRCSTCGRTRAARASDGGAWLSTAGEPGTRVSLVLPIETAALHDAMSRACWCRPKVFQHCFLCDGDGRGAFGGDCPVCGGLGMVDAYCDSPDTPTVISHNDPLI
jgi:hypothetical protein